MQALSQPYYMQATPQDFVNVSMRSSLAAGLPGSFLLPGERERKKEKERKREREKREERREKRIAGTERT